MKLDDNLLLCFGLVLLLSKIFRIFFYLKHNFLWVLVMVEITAESNCQFNHFIYNYNHDIPEQLKVFAQNNCG